MRPNLRHLLGIVKFFFSVLNLLLHFFGIKFTEILPGSRSKVEKTMKNLVFSIFDRDSEIIMEYLQQQSSVNFTPKKKWLNFFSRKKKNFLSDTFKMVVLAILRPDLRRFLEIENFFFNEFNLVLHFFGDEFTWNYYAVRIIP